MKLTAEQQAELERLRHEKQHIGRLRAEPQASTRLLAIYDSADQLIGYIVKGCEGYIVRAANEHKGLEDENKWLRDALERIAMMPTDDASADTIRNRFNVAVAAACGALERVLGEKEADNGQ